LIRQKNLSLIQIKSKKKGGEQHQTNQLRMGFIISASAPMGFIYDNLNNNSNFATASTKHVTFGKVETYEYTKVEPKASVKKKIQGFIDNALTIGNDENLKILIKNQPF